MKPTRALFFAALAAMITSCQSPSTPAESTDTSPVVDTVEVQEVPSKPAWYGATTDSLRRAYADIKHRSPYVDRGLYQVGDNIVFPLHGKKFRMSSVVTETEDRSIYKALGRVPSVKYYVFTGEFWEHSEAYIVDHVTGSVDTLDTPPVWSVNDKAFAELVRFNPMLDGYGGWRIWELDDSREWQLIHQTIEKDLDPVALKWNPEGQLLAEVRLVEESMSGAQDVSSDIIVVDQ